MKKTTILNLLLSLAILTVASNLSASNKIQAESGTYSGEARTSNVFSGYEGSGFAAYLTSVGSGIKVTPNMAAGQYNLDLKYAAGNNGPSTDRTMTLYVNGVNTGILRFPRTGSWASWDILTTQVNLTNGVNTIELKVDGGWDYCK